MRSAELSLLESIHLEEFDVVVAATGDDKVGRGAQPSQDRGRGCRGWWPNNDPLAQKVKPFIDARWGRFVVACPLIPARHMSRC